MTTGQHRLYIGIFFVIGILTFLTLSFLGASYYFLPVEERFFSPLHNILKPSGLIGHGIGIFGSIMMILGIVLYMARKRIRKFSRVGILKHWLEFHIFLCSVGPLLILYHTAFKFGGLVAVSFWSMLAVVISGVIGRFIYVQIPRNIQGNELSFDQLTKINDDLYFRLRNEYNVDDTILLKLDEIAVVEEYKSLSFSHAFKKIVKDYFSKGKLLNEIKSDLQKSNLKKESINEVLNICRSKLLLVRRIGLLSTMQKIFKYWHIIHLPFAIIMIIIMLIHISVAIVFGYTWIF